ncbi:MAG: VWA domain-containing protein [Hyphomicrobiaceae bacterium]
MRNALSRGETHSRFGRLAAFGNDQSGVIAILTALTFLILVGSAGLAVDFGRAYTLKAKMQSAVDSAALAAARLDNATESKRVEAGLRVFQANFDDFDAQFEIGPPVNGRVTATASLLMPTSLLGVLGMTELRLEAKALVPLLNTGKAEVVLVLDYSDSMVDANKYVRMAQAATAMIDTITDGGRNREVRIGLVPFSAVVRATLPAYAIRSDVSFTGCTSDRRYPFNVTEGVTSATDDGRWGGESENNHDCALVAAANLRVTSLSNDFPTIKSTLNSFQPHMKTHIALGAEFGWQVISPSGVFGGARPYNEPGNVKVVIILTDGMQTSWGYGIGGTRTPENGESNLLEICSGMKARGIDVYTIGYDLPDAHTLSLLQSCATPGNFFNAEDVATGVMAALSAIGTQISAKMVRLAE